MKCLVTGAAGFIGSHLCEALILQGFQVVGIDDFSVGRKSNLDQLKLNSNFELKECDIRIESEVSNLDSSFDYVFHLAALADIVPSMISPKKYLDVNVTGTVNILEKCKSMKLKKFLYAASSSCYGIPKHYPTNESSEISAEYPYALSKYLGEECVLHWSKVFKIPAVSLRLFNVFGPRVRTSGTYGAVFGVFLAQRLAGKPLTVVGDGRQTRDFTYVTDVVDAFVSAAMSDVQNEIYNVGSGGSYSINQLVTLLGGDRVTIPKRPGEPECTFADITKIKLSLGWQPKINFEQGVNNMLKHIDSWRDAPVWTTETIEKETRLWFHYLAERDSENL